MSDFREERPANRGEGTPETDSTQGLFRPGYVFGEPIQPVDDNPGTGNEMVAGNEHGNTEPAHTWATDPPNQKTGYFTKDTPQGSDGAWYLWDGVKPLHTKIPNGEDVRAVWIPNTPSQITITPGSATGSVMYAENSGTTGENIPIPKGAREVTLTSSAGAFPNAIYVFVTSNVFPPFKRAGGGGGAATGLLPIVVDTPGGPGTTPRVSIPLVHLGNGKPGFLAPVGDLYVDQLNGDLYQSKLYAPGAIGLTSLQLGDGACNLYRLNETAGPTAFDIGTDGINGTYSGTPAYNAAPLTGDNAGATHFDGTTSFVRIPIADWPGNLAHNNTSRYSMEGVLHGDTDTIIAATQLILGNTGVGGIDSFDVFGKHDAAGPYILNCRSNNFAPAQQNLNDGATNYHHFVMSFDGVNTNWYIDNVLIGTANDGNHMGFGSAYDAIYIGAAHPAAQWFKGRLQNFAFYRVALSAAQVTAHWNAIPNVGASLWKKFQQVSA